MGVAAYVKRNVPFNIVAEEILKFSCPRSEIIHFSVVQILTLIFLMLMQFLYVEDETNQNKSILFHL